MNNQETLVSSDRSNAAETGACLLCNRNDGPAVWRKHAYDVRYCSDCDVASLDLPPPAEQVDLTTELHDDSFYSRPAKLRADWLQTVRPSGKLLVLGRGSGHFLVECRKRGYEMFGCEPDPERADYCRKTHGTDVETAFIENTPLCQPSLTSCFTSTC